MRCSPKEVPVQQHSLQVRDGCGTSASTMVFANSLEGELLSSNEDAVEPFKKFVQELKKGERLTLEQIYNCDETGLYYLMIPDKTCKR